MQKVLMLKGLPGSGKSRRAKALQNENPGRYKRVNKDDLREMLDDGRWSPSNEKFVLALRDNIIMSALEAGTNVIVDDTNLDPKHEARISQLIKGRAELEVEFVDTPIEACIANDLKRPNSVGEKVIRDMYNRYLKPKVEAPEYNPDRPDAVICDLDGTLALFGDKNPYDRDFTQDTVNEAVLGILMRIDFRGDAEIVLVSGRNGKFRDQTEQWLKNYSIPYDTLIMRGVDDTRKDSIVKQEIYDENIKGKFNVLFVLDDRNQVVEMWRNLGLTCLQVAEGDF